MPTIRIPFNRPFATGDELSHIQEAIRSGHLSGNGQFTRKCQEWLVERTGARKALLTHSCTAALEMSAILADLQAGDEVVLPSFTFVSTANAFVLRGATPVFVDIRADTLNIDEAVVEAAITSRTRALCVVHYAGVACDMDPILDIARRHRLIVIEDAAQGVLADYHGRALGTIGDLGAVSFHETKNVISGEGGALLVNDEELCERAEIVWEKGTNRSAFFRGSVDKYTWVDLGSSFLPSEIIAAFLWAQLPHAREITEQRLALWRLYYDGLAAAESNGRVTRPSVPAGRVHNAHMFYILTRSLERRTRLLQRLASEGFLAVFHYVPLHSSPAGLRFGRTVGPMTVTDSVSDRLIRLPLWVGIPRDAIARIIEIVTTCA